MHARAIKGDPDGAYFPPYKLRYNYALENYLDSRLTFAIKGNDENSAKFRQRLPGHTFKNIRESTALIVKRKKSYQSDIRGVVEIPLPS